MSDNASSHGRIIRESGKLSALTLISRVLGLVREMTRAALMGTGVLAEAFTVAFTTPNLLRRLFAEGSMAVALIPTMRGYFAAGKDSDTEEFLSATFSMFVYAVGIVVAAGIAGSGAIAAMFAALAREGTVVDAAETAILLRIMFPFLALVSLAAFLQGILNARDVFGPPGYAPILFNLAFIGVPYLIGSWAPNPARAMAMGVVVGGLLQALCQLPAVIRLGARFRLVSPLRALANPGMKKVVRLIAPTIVGMAAYELNGLVSVALANASGSATSLSFSIRLQELILGIFIVSIGTVLLPELSGLAAAKDWERYVDRLVRGLETVLLITVPVAFFSIIERTNIVSVVYKSGAFGDESVRMTAEAFLYHSLGLVFIAIHRILAPAFYARGNTRLPAAAGVVAVFVNIVLALALSRGMGGGGIALALSVASLVQAVVLVLMLLGFRLPGLKEGLRSALGYALRLALYSGAAALPVYLLRQPLSRLFGSYSSRLLSAGLPLLLSFLVYAFIGVGLLALAKDRVALSLISSFGRRKN
jgi:putative peptidoglycan lipid II flippase